MKETSLRWYGMPKYKFKRTKETTIKEIRQAIILTKYPWLKALITFLYLYGCRITEALNLSGQDVWQEGNYIIAKIGVLKRRDKTKGPYENLPHLIHISIDAPLAKEYLLPYLNQTKKQTKLFPVSRQLVWLRLKELNQQISPHVFRHDRLMKLALKGASEAELMDWAGWTDSRPASNYIRATGRLAMNLANKID